MNVVFYLKMADALRDAGWDLIREYIPDSPVMNQASTTCHMYHLYLCTTHPHLSTHLQLLPQFLDWICLKKRKKKLSISSLLIHQHHSHQMVFSWMFHPVDHPASNCIYASYFRCSHHPSSRTLWTTTGYAYTITL